MKMETIKATERDVELDLVGGPGTVPLSEEALEKVAGLFEKRYPQLYAACGGGRRASTLGRAGLDVALTVTDAAGAVPALRTALDAVEDVLAEVGFETYPEDVAAVSASTGGVPGSSSTGAGMRVANLEVSDGGLDEEDLDEAGLSSKETY